MKLEIAEQNFRLKKTFTISRGSRDVAHVVTVTLTDANYRGRGECVPYARYGESIESVTAEIDMLRVDLANGLDRHALQQLLPAGAARNALDCALWDLDARRLDMPVWQLAGLDKPGPLVTACTLSLDTPETMYKSARDLMHMPLLKLKLGGTGDVDRLRAVRAGAPDSTLIVDANEGWNIQDYKELAPLMVEMGVTLIEQPLPAAADDELRDVDRPLPVCADEACHDRSTLNALAGKYDVVNIKLDKAGGLTEALALRDAARAAGYGIFVGCMVGSSLAMAPAILLAQGAETVDLDGPLLLAEDRSTPIKYAGAVMQPADAVLWG
jgi:L-alanine-DL-glutamate epimerase-like enolase superfamily enzyme